tara:strand:+ start:199 stop:396 length:198 start_codon:yes stop_codon:yes gene_type:complete
MKVALSDHFLTWFKQTNPHLYVKGFPASNRRREMDEYVNDVLIEHMESMQDLLDDDSPDSGFIEE